jgi:uncharacterized protein (DUF2336 family)
MRASDSLVDDLETAIRAGSQEKRAEMLRSVTDLFLGTADQFNREQVDLFDDVLGVLTRQVESNILAELGTKLAPVDNAPRKVVRTLARHNEIAVAGPVLAKSTLLSDRDLVEIAKTKGQDHLGAITERARIASAVTDILIERGDTTVVRRLSQNQGAAFSNGGFTHLTKRAEVDESLAENLAMRMDFPPQMLRQLVSKATEAVRTRLVTRLAPAGQSMLNDLLSSASEKTMRDAAAPRDFARAEAVINGLQANNQLNEAAVFAFAHAEKYEEMVVGTARLCSAPIELIERLIKNPRYDGILVACKASGLHWPTFKALVMGRFPGHQVSPAELERARADFIKLSAATAQRLFRFWLIRGAAKESDS